MSKKFLVSIDLNNNQLLNPVLHNWAAALPAWSEGGILMDTVNHLGKYYDGTIWRPFGVRLGTDSGLNLSSLHVLSMGTPSTITGATTNTISGSSHTHAITGGLGFIGTGTAQYQTIVTSSLTYTPEWVNSTNIWGTSGLNSLNYTSASFVKMTGANTFTLDTNTYLQTGLAVLKTDYNSTYSVLLTQAVANTPTIIQLGINSVLGRIDGNIVAIAIDNDLTAVSVSDDTLASAKAIKSYIDSSVLGTLVYQSGYDATIAPPTGTNIKKGFTYTVTVAGNGAGFFAGALQIGDMIIAEINNPIVDADWTQVNKNIPDIVNASTTVRGIIQIATTTEVTAGTDADKAITPSSLTSITKLGTITTGTWNATKIDAIYGGTGLTSYTVGDILYANSTTTLSKLGIGVSGQALLSTGSGLTWGNVGRKITGSIPAGTTYTTTSHGLTNVMSQVYITATGEVVECDMITISGTTTFNFNTSVTAGTYSYVILG